MLAGCACCLVVIIVCLVGLILVFCCCFGWFAGLLIWVLVMLVCWICTWLNDGVVVDCALLARLFTCYDVFVYLVIVA